MTVLGRGTSSGGVSLLHALGTGRGASVGINLQATVSLLDHHREVEGDTHKLLNSVMECWIERGFPKVEDFGWRISSDIPMGQGLKSSAAISCAAFRALNDSFWTGLSNNEIVELSVSAQIKSGCTVTGSMDDAWASISPGWKLVDPSLPSSESVIMEGGMDEGLEVLIGLRGDRVATINTAEFRKQEHIFQRALASLTQGSALNTISTNGMAVSAATGDFEAMRLCNLGIVSGAIAAGISGSGPAIVFVCFSDHLDGIQSNLQDHFEQMINTTFTNLAKISEEVI
ncbi:MAG TPA: hypothetical protein QF703_01430 [Candidatus Thalassarchaeaceae archaeon]|nr:hypothetical protein [Candidatus Thalassarchaeaceae archaeon]|tara:strand:+ start:1944 stop:2801 length:858 start_codon:yes stop_codon:yes gene_type:complete